MKQIFAVISTMLISLNLSAQVVSCPGSCVNTSSNSFYDAACGTAGQAYGQDGCSRYTTLGCVWKQGVPLVQTPEQCVNTSGNSFYDAACSTAGQANGQSGCNRYATLGCVWQPAAFTCQ